MVGNNYVVHLTDENSGRLTEMKKNLKVSYNFLINRAIEDYFDMYLSKPHKKISLK